MIYSQFHLLLHRHAPIRHLHSFPTRRSSDLSVRIPDRITAPPGATWGGNCAASSPSTPASMLASTRSFGRSEEHTSELQSQSNLVCRLLLEKKNFYCALMSHIICK